MQQDGPNLDRVTFLSSHVVFSISFLIFEEFNVQREKYLSFHQKIIFIKFFPKSILEKKSILFEFVVLDYKIHLVSLGDARGG